MKFDNSNLDSYLSSSPDQRDAAITGIAVVASIGTMFGLCVCMLCCRPGNQLQPINWKLLAKCGLFTVATAGVTFLTVNAINSNNNSI